MSAPPPDVDPKRRRLLLFALLGVAAVFLLGLSCTLWLVAG